MMNRLKYVLLRMIPPAWINVYRTLIFLLKGDYIQMRRRVADSENAIRIMSSSMLAQYHQLAGDYRAANSINQHEAKIYSQNGEDGILLYLLSKVGTESRRFVEFGIGDGRQCNCANLAINFGWSGLMMEIEPQKATAARTYYARTLGKSTKHVKILTQKVTAENINEILRQHDYANHVDLLSIDVDGNDYWIWQAISVIKPRIVVIEYNASFGPERSVTVKYDPNFNPFQIHPSGFYHGASITALAKLGSEKGYQLVGCDSHGINAFFVRTELAKGKLASKTAQKAYYPHVHRTMLLSREAQFDIIKHLDLVEV